MAQLPAKQLLTVSGTLLIIAAITVFGQIDRSIISPAPADTNNPISTSVRIIIVIDESASMCQNPAAGNCCTEGDGSDSCMMNDPDDIRIQAAQMFVDSLAARSPVSQVGVVTFSQSATLHNPISLTSAQNIQQIKNWIYEASCVATGFNTLRTTPAPGGLGKTQATKATYLGMGLQAGLTLADYDIDSMPAGTGRHIILLTDGAWDDEATRAPQTLVDQYRAQNPNRKVPVIHGVFISNAVLHTEHLYPPEGCSSADPVVLTILQHATTLGDRAGLYIAGSTPQTIIETMKTLLDTIAVSLMTSAQKPSGQPAIAPEYALPGHAETRFNLLGRKVDVTRLRDPSRNKVSNGIFLKGTSQKKKEQKYITIK